MGRTGGGGAALPHPCHLIELFTSRDGLMESVLKAAELLGFCCVLGYCNHKLSTAKQVGGQCDGFKAGPGLRT